MISASILSIKDNIKENVEKLSCTDIDFVHLDVMDGEFVSNKTFDINTSKDILNDRKDLDVHLMVNDIKKYIDEFKTLNPKYITFHVEVDCDIMDLINYVKGLGIGVGLAINPDTPVSVLYDYLPFIDLVLVMSVNPGYGGQKFIERCVTKVNCLKELKIKNKYSYLISIDGGVNLDTIKLIDNCDIYVVGSYLTNGDYYENLSKLKEKIYE